MVDEITFKEINSPKPMNKRDFSFEKPTVFTTGAFLQPLKVLNRDGNRAWFWVVSEFIDDTFQDGEIYNPPEIAQSKAELLELPVEEEN
jgi:hypothetical protein